MSRRKWGPFFGALYASGFREQTIRERNNAEKGEGWWFGGIFSPRVTLFPASAVQVMDELIGADL